MFGDDFTLFGQLKIFASAAVGYAAPIRSYEVLCFQPFERAVQSGLFQCILPLALFFDFIDDFITVFVPVVEGTQDNRIDVPADQIAADGSGFVIFFFFIIRVKIHLSQPPVGSIIQYMADFVNILSNMSDII